MSLRVKFDTARQLGLCNIVVVLLYRLGVRFGFNSACKVSEYKPPGVFFEGSCTREKCPPPRSGWWEQSELFGVSGEKINGPPPSWHKNFFNGKFADSLQPWWKLSDDDDTLGDIKGFWEASRFDWALACAQQAAVGNHRGVERLNDWLTDWCDNNQPYCGVNWMCGQEASIRIMHLAMAALIMGNATTPTPALQGLLGIHLKRIFPTIRYAIAQNNNHGTSEAAALFIGGTWLQLCNDRRGFKWAKMGRRLLEDRVKSLVATDGTFSQHSVNYHRVMVDTLCMVELWRSAHQLEPFSEALLVRMKAATSWLFNMVDTDSGLAPNYGANDGARLLPLTDTLQTDFRPTVQLSSVLFSKTRAYSKQGPWDYPLRWMKVGIPEIVRPAARTKDYSKGGMVIMRAQKNRDADVKVFFRYPHFRFRPSQCDLLHVDLWVHGVNVLRDGGTFSYKKNEAETLNDYFSGVRAHNTVQFDKHDQMPRLSRFLFGAWPRPRDMQALKCPKGEATFAVGYTDWLGATHHRSIFLDKDALMIKDEVSGFNEEAVIRWRLNPGSWSLDNGTLTGELLRIEVNASMPIVRQELNEGSESLNYGAQTSLPVLELEVHQPGIVTTEITFL